MECVWCVLFMHCFYIIVHVLQDCNPQCSAYSECIDCYFDIVSDIVVQVRNATQCANQCQEGIKKTVLARVEPTDNVASTTVNGDSENSLFSR